MSGEPSSPADPGREAVLASLRRAREADLLGPAPVEDHLTHALAYARAVTEAPGHAVDLGSGGGVPGLVLAALRWPACRWTLVDASAKRCRFLADRVNDLGLDGRVAVVHARAEDLGRGELRIDRRAVQHAAAASRPAGTARRDRARPPPGRGCIGARQAACRHSRHPAASPAVGRWSPGRDRARWRALRP